MFVRLTRLILIAVCMAGTMSAAWGGEVLLNPGTIHLGDVGAGRLKKTQAIMTFPTAGKRDWTVNFAEGWHCKPEQDLSGTIAHRHPARIQIAMKSSLVPAGANGNHNLYNVQLQLEFGNKHIVCQRSLASGPHREGIAFNVNGELKIIDLSYNIVEYPREPLLSVHPQRLDFSMMEPGQQAMGKIEITNRGRQPLKWQIEPLNAVPDAGGIDAVIGPYHSFYRPDIVGTGVYRPAAAKDRLVEFTGHWGEMDGYPEAQEKATLKYHFTGGEVIVYYWKSPAGKALSVYLDNQPAANLDAYSEQTVAAQFRLPGPAIFGPHTLTLVNHQGRVVIEGVKLPGKGLSRDQGKWLRIFPESGVTTREIDYLHLALDTTGLRPGCHGRYFLLSSNGGTAPLEIYVEVATEAAAKILDVYRYSHGDDLLFSTNPQGESRLAPGHDYRKDGIAFRLFSPGTPGTTEFYRWYSNRYQSHFYSYEAGAEGKLNREYLREGTIGNIATSRLANTRPLYRWHHAGKGRYFFTTDSRGEGMNKKGYKYDGIAGYVR